VLVSSEIVQRGSRRFSESNREEVKDFGECRGVRRLLVADFLPLLWRLEDG